MATSLELSRTYTSFSGGDIRAVVDGEPIGQLQAISYAVQSLSQFTLVQKFTTGERTHEYNLGMYIASRLEQLGIKRIF